MKRGGLALAFSMLTLQSSLSVAQVTVTLPSTTGQLGTSIDLPITVGNLTLLGVYTYQFTLTYDTSVVRITSVDKSGTMSSAMVIVSNLSTAGKVNVTAAGAAVLIGSGTLIYLHAQLVRPGTSALTWQSFQFNEGTPTATMINGTIAVPPLSPTLVSPRNGSTGAQIDQTLMWNASEGAASYRLQVSTDSTFAAIIYDRSGLIGISMSIPGLSYLTRYYWRVSAGNAGGTSEWSAVWSFTTMVAPPAKPTLAGPPNGSTVVAMNPTLTWNASAGATSYGLEVSRDSTFATTAFSQTGMPATSYTMSSLINGTVYYWKVNASNADGTSDWSNTWSFVLMPVNVTSFKPVQSGNVRFVYTVSTNELLSLSKFEYSTDNGTTWISTGNYSGKVSGITGSKSDTIYWDTGKDLPSIESRSIRLRLAFQSSKSYTIIVDSVGVDNLPPRLNGMKNVFEGWSGVAFSWIPATDMSQPVIYHLLVARADPSATTVLDTALVSDSLLVSGLYSSTQYKASLTCSDALGNVDPSPIDVTFHTGAVADYNGDGMIATYDLAAFVLAWTNNNVPSADLSPFQGSFPYLSVKGDGKLDLDDIYVFAKMWDYSHRVGLPSSAAATFVEVSSVVAPTQRNLVAHKGEPMEFAFSPELTGSYAALGVTMRHGSTVRADSVRVLLDGMSLIYNDTTRGIIYADVAKTGGFVLKGDNLIMSRLMLDPSKTRDSMEVELVGYGRSLEECVHETYLYTISIVPSTYALYQNYPNPFNPVTTISFDLSERAKVELTIYDVLGRKVEDLLDQEMDAGSYRVPFEASRFASGVYFYRITAGKFVSVKKLVILK